ALALLLVLLAKDHVPVFLVCRGDRLLAFAPTIVGGGRAGYLAGSYLAASCLAAFRDGCFFGRLGGGRFFDCCVLDLGGRVDFFSGVGFGFLGVRGHLLS